MKFILRLFAAMAMMCCTAQAAEIVDATIFTTHGEVPLRLEVAATPEARETGLMNRDTIGDSDGMLFLFPQPQDDIAFWMKDTRIPLDMLFICPGRHIVHIAANAKPFSLTRRTAPGHHIDAVIELDGGRAAHEGIAVGDHVRYDVPKSLEIR